VPSLVTGLREAGVDARLNVCEEGVSSRSLAGRWSSAEFAPGLGEWQPEIVHDHGVWLPSNHQAAAFAKRQDIPLVVSPRGMLEPWSMRHRRLKKKGAWLFYQGRDLRSAACLHATSSQEAAGFRKLGLKQPVIVLPNGVTLPEREAMRPAKRREGRVILFMSRIHPKKGLPLLIEAWRRVRKSGWTIRIIGPDEGGHADEVRRLAAEAGVGGDVVIESPVDDAGKWNVFAAADVFILPTYSENFGIVVAEALAAGVPVITTTGTPWSELEEWEAGWWVEPTANGIEAALGKAISKTDEELAAMGRRGREKVLGRYSWPAIAEQMREAYSWIINGGQAPGCVQRD
jgi:glycosyltransferase involved in cell wall biosynthesis